MAKNNKKADEVTPEVTTEVTEEVTPEVEVKSFETDKPVENKLGKKVYTVAQLTKMTPEHFNAAMKEIKSGKARAVNK